MDSFINNLGGSPSLINNIIITTISAILIFIIGAFIARNIRKKLRQSKFGGKHVDETLRPVIASLVFYVIMAITLYAVLIKLGVPPTSLIAVFGAAGIAVALALKDTLSNIAAGIMLLFLRPLSVGETVDMDGTVGTIEEIDLFSTTLNTPDGLYLYIPNGIIWNSRIKNFNRHASRRAIINIRIGFENDLETVQNLLLGILEQTPDILSEPDSPKVFVTSFENTAVHLSCRCWLPRQDWSQRVNDLHIDIKKALDKANINMNIPAFTHNSNN
ncbi:MAG: mechanosensitive ion channel family protein [Litorimonas sp.]